MAVLNSNPEILLRKRKDKDRKRIQKQEEAEQKALKKLEDQRKQKTNFVRAETLVARYKSTELENKRIRNITAKQEEQGLSDKEIAQEPKLLFIIRTKDHVRGVSIPKKARQILEVLKLTEPDTGVFVKATANTFALLNLVAPYIIIGRPSLASIRKLFQKRARIISPEEEDEQRPIRLDNNQVVEDKFGDSLGLLCIEDIVHEIVSLSDNFVTITSWLLPFKLNAPVNGWGPQAKLARLLYENTHKKAISLSRDFKIGEVEDIDSIIDQQN